MSGIYADRVRETTTSTGTGNLTLAGAVTGFQSFNSAYGVGPPFRVCIEETDAGGTLTGAWEVSACHLSASTTLVRDLCQSSSNSNAFINLANGHANVFVVEPALDMNVEVSADAFDLQYGAP